MQRVVPNKAGSAEPSILIADKWLTKRVEEKVGSRKLRQARI